MGLKVICAKMRNAAIISACIIVNFIGRTIYGLFDCSMAYFLGDAISWVLIAWYVLIKSNKSSKYDSIENAAAKFLAVMVCNNIYDETFGDPLKFGWNEYALLIGFGSWVIYKIIKCRN